MKKFAGFPDRMHFTPLPNLFFSSLLAQIDDLAELKVTLQLFRSLYEQRGFPRLVRLSQLAADRTLLSMLQSPTGEPPDRQLLSALDRACARGTFLGAALQEESEDRCYFLNTALNREMLKQVERGERTLAEGTVTRVEWATVPEQRPTIYDLYEQNVGLITPLIAEELQEAEESYPPEWIEDAFREAVSYNKRHWRYVRRILENWTENGRGEDGKGRRHSKGPGSPSKYLEGKYAHLLQR